MADSTLANLTAATAATGGLFYGTQSSADKKFTLTAAGATLIEAANVAAQVTALNAVTSGGALGTPSSGALTNCTSIPAGQLTGSVATARLGTGTASSSTYLRGDGAWAAVSGGSPGGSAQQVQLNNGSGGFSGTNTTATPTELNASTGAADSSECFRLVAPKYSRTFMSVTTAGTISWPQGIGTSSGGFIIDSAFDVSYTRTRISFGASASAGDVQLSRISSGVLQINNRSGGGGIFEMLQSTSGGTPSSNSARIYSKDVSGTAEMFVMDEAGNETQISPHNTAAPEILIDSAFDEIGYTANYYTGIITYTNKQRQIASRADAQFFETFEEHNLRIGESLEILDWDTVQADQVAKREEEREAWATRKAEWEANSENEGTPFPDPEPEVLTPKPIPTWLADQLAGKEAFLANRLQFKKSWSSKAEFWAEFTDTEKAAIITSEDIGVKMLDKELTMWSGVIIATDSRVITGLDKLVELDIITEARKDEIITL